MRLSCITRIAENSGIVFMDAHPVCTVHDWTYTGCTQGVDVITRDDRVFPTHHYRCRACGAEKDVKVSPGR